MNSVFVLTAESRTASVTPALRAGVEVASLVGGLFVIMWLMPIVEAPYWTRYALGFLLLLFMIGCHWRDGVDRRDLGLRLDNFRTALRQLAPATFAIAIVLVTSGWVLDSLREPARFLRGFAGVPAWGLVQHFMLLSFCHRRLQLVFGAGPPAVLATAVLFGLVHAPNPPLMLACTVAGGLWAWQFDRAPNLFATALSHGIASTCLSGSLPKTILHSSKVGYRYLFS